MAMMTPSRYQVDRDITLIGSVHEDVRRDALLDSAVAATTSEMRFGMRLAPSLMSFRCYHDDQLCPGMAPYDAGREQVQERKQEQERWALPPCWSTCTEGNSTALQADVGLCDGHRTVTCSATAAFWPTQLFTRLICSQLPAALRSRRSLSSWFIYVVGNL